MDKYQTLQESVGEQQSNTDRQEPVVVFPANPNSWFRQRLDHVRNEARKDLQVKWIRPLLDDK